MAAIRRESTPVLPASAALRACSPLAEIRPITASAWARSSLPFTKARRVNSPARQGGPGIQHRLQQPFGHIEPPWQESSTTSSPV